MWKPTGGGIRKPEGHSWRRQQKGSPGGKSLISILLLSSLGARGSWSPRTVRSAGDRATPASLGIWHSFRSKLMDTPPQGTRKGEGWVSSHAGARPSPINTGLNPHPTRRRSFASAAVNAAATGLRSQDAGASEETRPVLRAPSGRDRTGPRKRLLGGDQARASSGGTSHDSFGLEAHPGLPEWRTWTDLFPQWITSTTVAVQESPPMVVTSMTWPTRLSGNLRVSPLKRAPQEPSSSFEDSTQGSASGPSPVPGPERAGETRERTSGASPPVREPSPVARPGPGGSRSGPRR